jgi:hypothetical protein
MDMSKRIAGVAGPTLVALILSENPIVSPHLYDKQIPPVVYLSGTLFFVAGLATVRAHNVWTLGWPTLVTITGWFGIILGLYRMFAAESYVQAAADANVFLLAGEAVLLALGGFLTFMAYVPRGSWR